MNVAGGRLDITSIRSLVFNTSLIFVNSSTSFTSPGSIQDSSFKISKAFPSPANVVPDKTQGVSLVYLV